MNHFQEKCITQAQRIHQLEMAVDACIEHIEQNSFTLAQHPHPDCMNQVADNQEFESDILLEAGMANDLWRTPPEVFEALDQEFNFGLDICATHESALCKSYLTPESDALTQNWDYLAKGQWIWCNPPYSKIGPWVDKAIEAQLNGSGVVMLVMCDPSVKWFSQALDACSQCRFIINGRLAFLNDEGKPVKGNNKGSVIFVFNPHQIGARHTSYISRESLFDKGRAVALEDAA